MSMHELVGLNFGSLLRQYRNKEGWTLQQVGTKLESNYGIVISGAAVWSWESNQSIPKMATLSALLNVYSMTPTEKLIAYELAGSQK